MSGAISNQNSLRATYRLIQFLWIGCSALYVIAYLSVTDLAVDRTHGLLFASVLLLQATMVSAYAWRANFYALEQKPSSAASLPGPRFQACLPPPTPPQAVSTQVKKM